MFQAKKDNFLEYLEAQKGPLTIFVFVFYFSVFRFTNFDFDFLTFNCRMSQSRKNDYPDFLKEKSKTSKRNEEDKPREVK